MAGTVLACHASVSRGSCCRPGERIRQFFSKTYVYINDARRACVAFVPTAELRGMCCRAQVSLFLQCARNFSFRASRVYEKCL